MKKQTAIPTRHLKERGKTTFEIKKIEEGVVDTSSYSLGVEHRDDYYIFMYQERGKSNLTVDFQDITLKGNSIFCIQPGQVHFGKLSSDSSAWVIAVTSEWVPAEFRLLLMETTISTLPVKVHRHTEESLFRETLQLLQKIEAQPDSFPEQMVKSMFDVCLHLFMKKFNTIMEGKSKNSLRPELITRQFKSLLISNFRIMKSPAEYAASLNITPAYLNEVVKSTTGFSVSHWIHQEIILDAKRTLFYSNDTVKEIAYSLGYTDPGYFIRLFKKVTGTSPLQFRHHYPK